jgi:uncharacterized protein (UPF0147 family)
MKRVSPMIEKHKLNPVLWVSNTFGGEKYYYKAAANITNTVKYPEWFLHDNNGKLITKKESGVDHVFLNPFSKSLQVEQQRLVLKFANVLRANEVMYDDNAIPLKDEVFMEAVEFKNKYGQNPTDQNRQDVYRSRLKFLRKMLHDDNKKFLLSTQYSMDKRNSRFDSPVMAANYADEHIPQVYHKNKENPELDYEFHKVISGRVREHRQALKIKSDLKVTPLVIGDENIPQNITKMANCIYSEFNTPSIGIFMNIGHLSKLEEIKSTK